MDNPVQSVPWFAQIPDQGDITQPGPLKKAFKPFGASQPLYFPLLHDQVIRLAELSPGTWNDPISIRLFITELDHAPQYDAISYVWGDPSVTVPIKCNGRPLEVTLNLQAALKRIRLTDHPRLVWADAICINQLNTDERSHHVSFMGDIYRNARKVLVYMGKDTDGGAEDAASLTHDIANMISRYPSVTNVPILAADDILYSDPRWKSIATLHNLPWFERAWVIQEVGLALDPRILYGGVEFPYRDFMKLAVWTTRCAPNLETRFGISFSAIHTDWEDWSDNWRSISSYPNQDLMELFNHARGLSCRDPRDHIYSLLGHPLARIQDDESGRTLIIDPDYNKDHMEVWFDLAKRLLTKYGLRVIAPVEHNEENILTDYPSWVPWSWPEEYTLNTFGVFTGFYYAADGGDYTAPLEKQPYVDDSRQLHVYGTIIDSVLQAFEFSKADLAASPDVLRSTASLTSSQSGTELTSGLISIWDHIQELASTSSTAYGSDWLIAFSITLLAGLSTYNRAEDNLVSHLRHFAAYFRLWLQATYGSDISQVKSILDTLSEWEQAGQLSNKTGDADKVFIDFKLVCQGRGFFITKKGYFGLGSFITKPGDQVCILFGARTPFILRECGSDTKTNTQTRYKLVQEAYVHGMMHGEAMAGVKDGEFVEEEFIIC